MQTHSLSKGERTKEKIKVVALKLFAQNGLESVSVRDINRAAGQKNAGSINYHFSSRDDLIRELMVDVAKAIDREHLRRITEAEAQGGPHSIRDVVDILVATPSLSTDRRFQSDYSLRFLNLAVMSRREMLFDAMRGEDVGTRKCLAHIARLAPGMPPELLRQRLTLMMIYLFSAASSREEALNATSGRIWERLWGNSSARENLTDTIVGIICAPVSAETMSCLAAEKGASRP